MCEVYKTLQSCSCIKTFYEFFLKPTLSHLTHKKKKPYSQNKGILTPFFYKLKKK